MKVVGTTTVTYVKNPEAVADAVKLMAYFERRYLMRRAAAAKGSIPPESPSTPA